MRLSKRQLKLIIREEYARLHRRRIVNEAFPNYGMDNMSPEAIVSMAQQEMSMCIQDQSNCKGPQWEGNMFIADVFIAQKSGVSIDEVRSQDVYDLVDDLYESHGDDMEMAGIEVLEFEADM